MNNTVLQLAIVTGSGGGGWAWPSDWQGWAVLGFCGLVIWIGVGAIVLLIISAVLGPRKDAHEADDRIDTSDIPETKEDWFKDAHYREPRS